MSRISVLVAALLYALISANGASSISPKDYIKGFMERPNYSPLLIEELRNSTRERTGVRGPSAPV